MNIDVVAIKCLITLTISTSLFDFSNSSTVGFVVNISCIYSVQEIRFYLDSITHVELL